MKTEKEIKPGMDTYPSSARPYPNAADSRRAGQGRRPVDPYVLTRLYPAVLSLRLTHELRDRLNGAAERAGISASSYVRNLVADACGEEAPVDRESGRRVEIHVPPEELAAATSFMAMLTKLVLASRDLGDGKAGSVIQALELQHGRLVKLIDRMER